MQQNTTLPTKKQRAISALLTSKTTTEAAAAAAVDRTTIARWLKEDSFKQALREAEAEIVGDTVRRLVSGNQTALDIIEDLMGDNTVKANIRLRAADLWLDHSWQFKQLIDMENRLAELEAKLLPDEN